MITITNRLINNKGNASNLNTFEDGSNPILDANPIPMKKIIRRQKYSALEFAEALESKRKEENEEPQSL